MTGTFGEFLNESVEGSTAYFNLENRTYGHDKEYTPNTEKMKKLVGLFDYIERYEKYCGIPLDDIGGDLFEKAFGGVLEKTVNGDKLSIEFSKYGIRTYYTAWMRNYDGKLECETVREKEWGMDEVEKHEDFVDFVIEKVSDYIKKKETEWSINENTRKFVSELESDHVSEKIGYNQFFEYQKFIEKILTGLKNYYNILIDKDVKFNKGGDFICLFPDTEKNIIWKDLDMLEEIRRFVKEKSYSSRAFFNTIHAPVEMLLYNDFEKTEIVSDGYKEYPVKIYILELKPFADGSYCKMPTDNRVRRVVKKRESFDGIPLYNVVIDDPLAYIEIIKIMKEHYNGDIPEESRPYSEYEDEDTLKSKPKKEPFVIRDRALADIIFKSVLKYEKYDGLDEVAIQITC